MQRIIREYEMSRKYYFSRVDKSDENSLIKLSQRNVAIVEAMIHFDSSYRRASDSSVEGSSAFYYNGLKAVLIDGKKMQPADYRNLIKNIVVALDKENSTHLSSDGGGIEIITDRICSLRKSDLVRYLKDPEGTKYKLLNMIAEKTKPKGKSESGNKRRGRSNLSFASKFCHYSCFYLFRGRKEQDNYSIYDSVIRKKALPEYMKYYGIEKRDLEDYTVYQKTIDEIIKKSGSKISRNGFDHLLWYCYKGMA